MVNVKKFGKSIVTCSTLITHTILDEQLSKIIAQWTHLRKRPNLEHKQLEALHLLLIHMKYFEEEENF